MFDFSKELQKIKETMIQHVRFLHQHPEIGFCLPETTKYIKTCLETWNIPYQIIGKGGIVASIGSKKGKTMLLRADMDGLPMPEETNLPHASKNGNMHACGHDYHTAALLGCAQIMKKLEAQLKGNVKLMFQPAEEILAGARDMVKHHVLKDVDCAFAIHTSPYELHKIHYRTGPFYAASDLFTIRVSGLGCHGATPEKGHDPILVGSHIIQNLQAIQSREISAQDHMVLTIGKVRSGNAANIIPEHFVMEGTLRTLSTSIREFGKKRCKEIVENTAKMFGCQAEINFYDGCPAVFNDEKLTSELLFYIEENIPSSSIEKMNEPIMASEDFSFISEKIPSCMILIGAATPNHPYQHHHPKMILNEDVLPFMTNVLCVVSTFWLENHQ